MGYITAGRNQMHYVKMGSGDKLLLAFHGYGESAEIFRLFELYLGKEYTILSLDLPFHGESEWDEEYPLIASDLRGLVENVCTEYGVEHVSLMGYSIGGRVCLSTIATVPEAIDKVLLLAADGLAGNGPYYFFTRTDLGKLLFRKMLLQPDLCIRTMNILRRWKLLSLTTYKLLKMSIETAERRSQLLQAWPALRWLIPDTAVLKNIIRRYKTPIFIFMGKYDRVLPPRFAKKFAKGLPSVSLFIPEKGHRIFDETNAMSIAEKLL